MKTTQSQRPVALHSQKATATRKQLKLGLSPIEFQIEDLRDLLTQDGSQHLSCGTSTCGTSSCGIESCGIESCGTAS